MKARPESGLDRLICAIFARQRRGVRRSRRLVTISSWLVRGVSGATPARMVVGHHGAAVSTQPSTPNPFPHREGAGGDSRGPCPLPSRTGAHTNLKPRLEFGLDCLTRAVFVGQRDDSPSTLNSCLPHRVGVHSLCGIESTQAELAYPPPLLSVRAETLAPPR